MHASLPFLLLVRYWVQPMIKFKQYPSQSRLKELFDYIDGHLVWKARPRSDFKTPQGYGAFNALRVGKIACQGRINGYWIIKISREYFYAHRLIWIWNYGDLEYGQEIDHKDGDKENYSLSNLRIADRQQNTSNRGAQSNSKTGVKGVCWDKSKNKWHAQIKLGGKLIRKRFVEFDDAVEFARKTREELHGEFHNHGD